MDFRAAPEALKQSLPKFRIPRFFHTLSEWMNLLVDTGFQLERLAEPSADEETLHRYPALSDTRIVALFLIVLCRKPG